MSKYVPQKTVEKIQKFGKRKRKMKCSSSNSEATDENELDSEVDGIMKQVHVFDIPF